MKKSKSPKTREQKKKYLAEYYAKNRKKYVKMARDNRAKKLKELGSDGIKKQNRLRYEKSHENSQNIRKNVISFYSKGKNQCVCCGVKGLPFLTIDHIIPKRQMDKNSKLKKIGYSSRMNPDALVNWLYKYHPEGFQILCWNCNYAKGAEGQCPHQKIIS
jgi:5-methylcytosine-specific restriction endonuclease McrA